MPHNVITPIVVSLGTTRELDLADRIRDDGDVARHLIQDDEGDEELQGRPLSTGNPGAQYQPDRKDHDEASNPPAPFTDDTPDKAPSCPPDTPKIHKTANDNCPVLASTNPRPYDLQPGQPVFPAPSPIRGLTGTFSTPPSIP